MKKLASPLGRPIKQDPFAQSDDFGRQGTVGRVSIYSWQEKYQVLQILLCMLGGSLCISSHLYPAQRAHRRVTCYRVPWIFNELDWKVVSEGEQNTKLIEYCCSAFLFQCSFQKKNMAENINCQMMNILKKILLCTQDSLSSVMRVMRTVTFRERKWDHSCHLLGAGLTGICSEHRAMSGEITAACRRNSTFQWLGALSVAESWLQTIFIPLANCWGRIHHLMNSQWVK